MSTAAEVFSNQASTAVSSGGTDAPASGTVESWTVASPGNFPSASSGASPPTQFHVCDIATGKNSEIVAVTEVSGNTWTVTRGAEGSTPVAHSAGFTVQQVMTAGWLGSVVAPTGTAAEYLIPRATGSGVGGGAAWSSAPAGLQVIWADLLPGVDPTGVNDSTAAIRGAQTAAGTAPYLIGLGAGNYLVGTGENLAVFGPNQGMIGVGSPFTTIVYAGNATCIAAFETVFNDASQGGRFGGFTLDGYSAGSAAVGLSWGNLQQANCADMAIYGFGGGGMLLANGSGNWSEEGSWKDITLVQNGGSSGANVTFSSGSFDYSIFEFVIVAVAGTDGLRLQDVAQLQGCRLEVRGNFYGGSGNTGAVIAMSRGGTGDTSYIINTAMDISVETDGTATPGHYTVYMASENAVSQFYGSGILSFYNNTINFQGVYNPNNLPFGFSGVVNDEVYGLTVPGDGLGVIGGATWSQALGLSDSPSEVGGTVYWQFGDVWAFTLPSGNTTLTFDGESERSRRVEILIGQPATGSAGTITWPANVKWSGGSHALSATNGVVDKVRMSYYPSQGNWYGEVYKAYS